MKWLVDKIVDFRLWIFEIRIDWSNVRSVTASKASEQFYFRKEGLIARRNDLRKAYNRY
jgi:hypothetical protein